MFSWTSGFKGSSNGFIHVLLDQGKFSCGPDKTKTFHCDILVLTRNPYLLTLYRLQGTWYIYHLMDLFMWGNQLNDNQVHDQPLDTFTPLDPPLSERLMRYLDLRCHSWADKSSAGVQYLQKLLVENHFWVTLDSTQVFKNLIHLTVCRFGVEGQAVVGGGSFPSGRVSPRPPPAVGLDYPLGIW